jgi:hypothetical protein
MSGTTAPLESGASVALCQRYAPECIESGRACQLPRVLGDNPGPGPTLQLGNRPAGQQAQCVPTHAGWRARWKIENETLNTLKNQGDNFEHTYGHGEKNLSVVFATLMMLAFFVDQTQQWCCALFQAVWVQLGSKRLLWERMRALLYDYALTSMRQLFEALLYGFKKSQPIIASDAS